MLVADVKSDSGKGAPSWVDQERSHAVANFRVCTQVHKSKYTCINIDIHIYITLI